MVGRYRRVTPLDVFRSLPDRVAAIRADEMVAEVYAKRADYYHLPVSVVAPAYYELARNLLHDHPYKHLPAYADWRGGGQGGLASIGELKEREAIIPPRKGKYEILSVLGEGTYGVVVHA